LRTTGQAPRWASKTETTIVTENDGFSSMVAFQVRGKSFCYLNPAGESRFAWVEIQLAKVDPQELEAWRLSAPKRLTSSLVEPSTRGTQLVAPRSCGARGSAGTPPHLRDPSDRARCLS
jgi:hypothetical protein